MGVTKRRQWITGEELGRERLRLIQNGVPDDAPEFDELWARVRERDEALWEEFGKSYRATDEGRWIAIAPDGRVIIRDKAFETIRDASKVFGEGNFAMRKLADFPGHRFHG